MAKSKPRIKLPKSAEKGEVITVKTIISHKMESGQRKDKKTGEKIPRSIINKFECKFNGQYVFGCDLEPAVSANPYFQFDVKIEEAGEFEFVWNDDNGETYSKKKKIKLS